MGFVDGMANKLYRDHKINISVDSSKCRKNYYVQKFMCVKGICSQCDGRYRRYMREHFTEKNRKSSQSSPNKGTTVNSHDNYLKETDDCLKA